MSLVRMIARPLLAAAVVAQGVDVYRHPREHTDKAAPFVTEVADATGIPDEPERYVKASGIALAVAGVALGAGIAPRVAGWTIAGLLSPVTAVGYQFWRIRDKDERRQARRVFVSNAAIIGGALLAGVDTEGRPSVSWRMHAKRAERQVAAQAAKAAKDRDAITA